MSRVDEFKSLHGKEISKQLFEEIKSNYYLSKHAQEQLANRSSLLHYNNENKIDYYATKNAINKELDKYILAYYNTDGSVNIAIDELHYFVFVYCEDKNNWKMITYKEPSWYSINIYEKQRLALDDVARKNK